MSRLRCRTALPAAFVVAGLLLSGCGGGDRGSIATSDRAPAGAPVPAVQVESADQSGGSGEAARREPAAGRTKAATGTGPGVEIAGPTRTIVYTGEMTVRAKDVTAAAENAKRIVTAAGGRLDSEESSSSGRHGDATLVFKIPPDAYQRVVAQLGKDLGERESLRQTTEDVTEQVADVESRLKSAQASLGQLRTLLGKAKTIGEVLSVEREISSREADLESLQARQKALAAQTAAATLTLRLIGPAAVVTEPEPEDQGFLSGLRDGWRAMVNSAKVALMVLGALLPWLVVLAALWFAVVLVRRPSRRRAAASARGGEDDGASPDQREQAAAGPDTGVPAP
ncbi:lipoprotein [Sphaerisporangium krabiense]|uniref:DUF4349 domain-containing protein n=1 Tax=Sphaerisporangium krabiense TaxID=763782 RepID=A0A7W9DT52_9ACTN|nr:DUF4349 domain-containing protein [Sphaerisporangium krabiense]MBB5630427.1 hypothetical protein [Sphaerisporangium krabiense]GII62620.1 lipoprotein [Sphaerisporangium krabiense]